MDSDTLYSIGDLARRTGLTVRTIRFYSDCGIVAPTGRSPAGYRLYDLDAIARLDLVRTLRDLGVDLPTIRKVVNRELSLPAVAAAHAEALDVQIRTLRLRRAVLTAVATRGSAPEEMELMHKLARPRRLARDEAAERGQDDTPIVRRGIVAVARDQAAPALAARVEPASSQAALIAAALTAHYAHIIGRPDDAGLQRQLLARLEAVNDPRRERYLALLAVINGWPAPESLTPVLDWSIQALDARVPG